MTVLAWKNSVNASVGGVGMLIGPRTLKTLNSIERIQPMHVVHPYSSIDVTAAWKKLRFILSVRSDFHIIDSLLIAVHAFVNLVSMSFSVDATLLPR